MSFKVITFAVIILIQIAVFFRNKRNGKFLPFFLFNMYTIKPIVEAYFPLLDTIVQIIIIISVLLELYKSIKNTETVRYDKYLIGFFLLIVINGLYNGILSNTISTLYIQGLTNYLFIIILIFYFINTITNEMDFKEILSMTKYNGLLIFIYSVYDKFVLALPRIGDSVNPNYMSQISIILLLFYIFSTNNRLSIKSIIYYLMLFFVIIWSDSSSGVMALGIIFISFLLFNLKSSLLIILSNYLVWIIMFYYMFIVIITANYEFGILELFVKNEDTSRVILWQYTYENIKAHPVMGVPYNTFRAPWGSIELVTHNDYLRLMVELGIGSIILLFLMVNKQVNNIVRYKSIEGYFLFTFIMITLSFSLSHNNINNFMFWFALVLPSMPYFDKKIDNKVIKDDYNKKSDNFF